MVRCLAQSAPKLLPFGTFGTKPPHGAYGNAAVGSTAPPRERFGPLHRSIHSTESCDFPGALEVSFGGVTKEQEILDMARCWDSAGPAVGRGWRGAPGFGLIH